MKRQGSIAKFFLGLAVAGLLLASCTKNPTDKPAAPAKSAVELKRIEVPSRVLSIAGEVLAFAARGEVGRAGEASVSLRRLQARFGDFKRALVFEYDKDGKVLSQQEANVLPDGAIAFRATAGNRYLVYADLGRRFSDSYVVACGLSRARIPKQVVPRICTQLFCSQNFFKASTLKSRIPELKEQPGLDEFGDGVVGGFNGSGNICEECLHPSEPNGDFVPARGCSQTVPLDPEPSLPPDEIIFTRFLQVGEESQTQIFKLKSDGTEVNLSNNEYFEGETDVNNRTKKVAFFSTEGGLFTMDANGGNRTAISGTVFDGDPAWSRSGESFFVSTNIPGNVDNSLHRVRPDGSENVEIVKALPDQVIRSVDVVDDNHVIYSQGRGNDGDLFIKDLSTNDPPVNLTNTKDQTEHSPIVSHGGSLIAFAVSKGGGKDEIHIVRLTLPATFTEIGVIRLNAPAGRFARTLDFFSDDSALLVAASVLENEGTTNGIQLFSIKLNGTGQVRLTVNDHSDVHGSVIPRTVPAPGQ